MIAAQEETINERNATNQYETIIACSVLVAIAIIQAVTEPHKALPSITQKLFRAISGACYAELLENVKHCKTGTTLYEKHCEF